MKLHRSRKVATHKQTSWRTQVLPAVLVGTLPLFLATLLVGAGDVGGFESSYSAALMIGYAAIATFAIVLERRGNRRREALRDAELRRRLAEFDPGSAAFSREYLQKRLEDEILRSRRYGLELTVIAVRARKSEEVDLDVLQKTTAALVAIAARDLRFQDMAGYLGGNDFALLLPHTGLAGAQQVLLRLEAQLSHLTPAIGIEVLEPGQEGSVDEIFDRALLDADRRQMETAA